MIDCLLIIAPLDLELSKYNLLIVITGTYLVNLVFLSYIIRQSSGFCSIGEGRGEFTRTPGSLSPPLVVATQWWHFDLMSTSPTHISPL